MSNEYRRISRMLLDHYPQVVSGQDKNIIDVNALEVLTFENLNDTVLLTAYPNLVLDYINRLITVVSIAGAKIQLMLSEKEWEEHRAVYVMLQDLHASLHPDDKLSKDMDQFRAARQLCNEIYDKHAELDEKANDAVVRLNGRPLPFSNQKIPLENTAATAKAEDFNGVLQQALDGEAVDDLIAHAGELRLSPKTAIQTSRSLSNSVDIIAQRTHDLLGTVLDKAPDETLDTFNLLALKKIHKGNTLLNAATAEATVNGCVIVLNQLDRYFAHLPWVAAGLNTIQTELESLDAEQGKVPKLTNEVDKFFYETYDRILNEGVLKADRTGVGTKAVVGVLGRFDISLGRAVLPTTKELLTASSFNEMIHLFVAGTSSIKGLRDRKIGIWDDWFIPGTATYDEPSEPYLLEYRVQLAHEAGLEEELYHWLDGFKKDQGMVREENENQNFAEMRLNLCPSFTSTWDLFASEVRQLQEWLTNKGIPVYRKPGGQPVSLQKRLSRVSKNDTAKWDQINAVIDDDWEKLKETEVGVQILRSGEDVKLTVFKEGKFQQVAIRPIVAQGVVTVLDHLKVPAYPLLDADIGEGSYGVQWRKWQDTQLCGDSIEEFEAYMQAGYELVGTFPNAGTGVQVNVMHREIDQLQNAINDLKTNPDSRRIIVIAWNPGRIWQAALPPCHLYFQFISHEMTLAEREEWREHYVEREGNYLNDLFAKSGGFPVSIKGEDYVSKSEGLDDAAKHELLTAAEVPTRKLSCFVLLRSNDMFLGAPFNVAQYSLLTHMVAHVTGHATAELVVTSVDAHLYTNTFDQAKEQMSRSSVEDSDARIYFDRFGQKPIASIDDFKYEDIKLEGYKHHDRIAAPVAV